jgi:hypothetical protein
MGVDFWFCVNIAENAHEDTASGVDGGFLSGDAPTVDEALDEGVVARDLFENTFSKSINARVTDVGDDHLRADPDHRTDRRAHAGELGVLFDGGGQLAPSLQDVGKQGLPGLINAGVGTIEPGEVLDSQSAGHVTTSVTSHAVCDDVEVPTH